MDEILFHISRHLEALQLEIDSGLQYCRNLKNAICETVKNVTQHATQRMAALPWADQFKHGCQRIIVVVQNSARTCITVLVQPGGVYSQILDITKIEMPIIYPGSAGLVTGIIIGLLIGFSFRVTSVSCRKMKAIVSFSYNGISTTACIADINVPHITDAREVLIQVKSASVDMIDIKVAYGYGRSLRSVFNKRGKRELPVILGRDCSGVIVEIGNKVTKFDIGEEVMLVSPFWKDGTLAEYVIAKESMIARKPTRLTFEASAAIPYAGCLAYNACLKAGIIGSDRRKRVLIHSGVSPVGCMACQIAKLYNCEVTVTCTARAGSVARFIKADKLIIYGQTEMENELSRDRFDVVVNTVGGTGFEACLKLCKPDGIVVSTVPEYISYDDYKFPFNIFHFIYLQTQYYYRLFSGKSDQWHEEIFSAEVLDRLRALVDARALQPVVDRIYSLDEAGLALQHCTSLNAIGKTVVKVN